MRFFVCLACLAVFFCWGSAAAVAGAAVIYPLPEAKLFVLQERTVAAVAIEHRLPGKDIEEVLGYQLTAENLGAGRVRFVLNAPLADQTVVSTVRRKTVKGRDGIIRLRTYLVFSIPRIPGKSIPTIVIDPGHGGGDTGAVRNFIQEKDINLDISLRAARLFREKGWNAVLTRETDVEPSLLDRADAANILNATVFVSVHNNSLPEEAIPRSREFGTTVLYNASALQPATELARIMQDELVGALGTQREALQDRPRLVVLNSTWVPAVLTEGIMMPNPGNAKLILDRIHRQRTAAAILRAIETWRGRKVAAATKSVAPTLAPIPSLIPAPPQSGNFAGNTANRGTVGARDGWIYYLRKADSLQGETEERLWRFRPDRFLSDELVRDAEIWDLNVTPEGLYYSNWSDGQKIYRASLNGANPEPLTDAPAQQLGIAGDRLVFVRNRQIFTMPRRGGMAFLVTEDVAENTVAWGDWIYYANGSDGFRPYRIKLDGTGRMKIADDETLFLAAAGDWLFYSNLSDGEKLYRVRNDGSQRSKVTDDRVGYLNFDQHFLYYTNTGAGNALFRIRPDGGGRQKLMDGGAAPGPVGIAGGKVYYRGLFEDLK